MRNRFAVVCALFLPLTLAGCAADHYYDHSCYAAPPPINYQEVAFHAREDGQRAAEDDYRERRYADLDSHGRYRKPPVPPEAWHQYRKSFREGYREVYQHSSAPPPRVY